MIKVLLIVNLFFSLGHSTDTEMTIIVESGREDCLFQEVKQGHTIDFEYQVIDGGHGDLDITFRLADPTGRILLADFKKPENIHRIDAALDGEYRFCFDNTFSSYNAKTVFFGLLVDKDVNESSEADEDSAAAAFKDPSSEVGVGHILRILESVLNHLSKCRHLQEVIKSFEARDRNIAEENYYKVNLFSIVQIFIMIFVGLVQVLLVKSLFEVDSKVQKLLKKLISD